MTINSKEILNAGYFFDNLLMGMPAHKEIGNSSIFSVSVSLEMEELTLLNREERPCKEKPERTVHKYEQTTYTKLPK